IGGPGDPADGDQHVAAGDLLAGGERHHDPVVGAPRGLGTGAGAHGDAAAAEGLLEHVGGLRIGAGQHLVSRGDQGDLAAQGPVRARELGTGHAGADDDQVLGQGVQLVQLGPVQDPLAVAGGAVQLPGASPDREQDHVRLEALDPPPVAGEHLDAVRPVQPARPVDDPHAGLDQAGADVDGLGGGELAHAGVDRGEVDVQGVGGGGGAVVGVADAQLLGASHEVEHVGGGDQRLGGHHVRDHRGTADAALLDEHGLRAVPRRGQSGLVPAGAPADDHHPDAVPRAGDARGVRGEGGAGVGHGPIVAKTARRGAVLARPPGRLRYLRSMTSSGADPYQRAREAAAASAEASGVPAHELALVLGSGWSGAADLLGETVWQADASTIPGFRPPAVAGHVGTLRSIRVEGTGARALVLGARTHYYEGAGVDATVHGVRTAAATGARTMVLTNGCGGIDPSWAPGTPVLIRDQINFTGATPLRGADFVDLTDLY